MNVLFVYELNVLGSSVISAEHLYMVGLNGAALFNNAFVGIGKHFREETLPFAVGKGVIVQKLQLPSEVGNQAVFVMDGKVLIPLRGQQPDELLFKSGFALKAVRECAFRRIFSHYGALVAGCYNVIGAHRRPPSFTAP